MNKYRAAHMDANGYLGGDEMVASPYSCHKFSISKLYPGLESGHKAQ